MSSVSTTERLRAWLVRVFAQTIGKISNQGDVKEVIAWLEKSRDVIASNKTKREKMSELYELTDTRKAAKVVAHGVVDAVKNYKNSDLPIAVKIAIPATLLAAPFIGGQGAGVAALGSALGLPVLLLVFLGTAGITSVLESVVVHKDSLPYLIPVLELIARDEIARRVSAQMKDAMRADPIDSRRFTMPADEEKLRQKLLAMDPFDFESHVVSFFKVDGMLAWVTKKSNDLGVDGFVERGDDLFVIQCKRYSSDNPVGGPAVQQFKGVVEENGASRGYLVTTSSFTAAARESASKSDRMHLIDMDDLIAWHAATPSF